MLPNIQSLWIGDELSQLEKLCIKSFMDHGHEFHLYTYGDIGGIPEGTIIKDGNEILPESVVFKVKGSRIAPFSDWFRYAMLAKKGNFWVDMDTVCVKPFDFEEEIVFGMSEYLTVAVGIMKFPKGHDLMMAMDDACRNHTQVQPWDDAKDKKQKFKMKILGKDRRDIRYVQFGSSSFHKAIHYYELEKYGKPYMFFHVSNIVYWEYWFDNTFADGVKLYEDTYSLHLSNSRLNDIPGFDKNATFAENSAFEQLKRKHGIAPVKNAPTFSHEQVQQMLTTYHERRNKKNDSKIRKHKEKYFVIAIVSILAGYVIGSLL